MSLTVRLWANIFASDMIYGLFLGLFVGPVVWGLTKSPVLAVVLGVFPALIPLIFVALHIFVPSSKLMCSRSCRRCTSAWPRRIITDEGIEFCSAVSA